MAKKEAKPLPFQLAQASWIAPLLVIGVNHFMGGVQNDAGEAAQRALVITVIVLGLLVFGLVSGVLALASMGKHGKKGIFVPATIGLLLNLLFLAVLVTVFVGSAMAAG